MTICKIVREEFSHNSHNENEFLKSLLKEYFAEQYFQWFQCFAS